MNNVMHKPDLFFPLVRKLTGPLNQGQTDIINDLLTNASKWSIAYLAYGLATAWHEARFIPQREIGLGKSHKYGTPGIHNHQIPYGRGLVQLTWDRNYEIMDNALDLDGSLIANYDEALKPDIAVQILVRGMEKGLFTGKSLSDYLPYPSGSKLQFVAARRIINVQDCADKIAGYAMTFQNAIVNGEWKNG